MPIAVMVDKVLVKDKGIIAENFFASNRSFKFRTSICCRCQNAVEPLTMDRKNISTKGKL